MEKERWLQGQGSESRRWSQEPERIIPRPWNLTLFSQLDFSFWILFYFSFSYSRFLLVIYFIHVSVYMSIPISHFTLYRGPCAQRVSMEEPCGSRVFPWGSPKLLRIDNLMSSSLKPGNPGKTCISSVVGETGAVWKLPENHSCCPSSLCCLTASRKNLSVIVWGLLVSVPCWELLQEHTGAWRQRTGTPVLK